MAKRNAFVVSLMACLLVTVAGCGIFNGSQAGPAQTDPKEVRGELAETQMALNEAETELLAIQDELAETQKALDAAEVELASQAKKLTGDAAAIRKRCNLAEAAAKSAKTRAAQATRERDQAVKRANAAEKAAKTAEKEFASVRRGKDRAVKAAAKAATDKAKKKIAELEMRRGNLLDQNAKLVERIKKLEGRQ